VASWVGTGLFSVSMRPAGLEYVLGVLFLISSAPAGLATSAPDRSALLKAATAFHSQGDYGHSIPILKELVARFPADFEGNLLLGEDLLRNGNVEASLTPLREAAAVRPSDGTALALLADAAIDLGDLPGAAEAMQAAVAKNPESEAFLVKWADFSLDRSRDVGIALRRTRSGEAVMLRVNAASRAERDEVRESLLAESAAKSPEQPGIWGELGAVQVALGKRSEAEESLKNALQREPESTETLQLEALTAAFDQRWMRAAGKLYAIAARSPADLSSTFGSWPRYLVPEKTVQGKVWDCLRSQNLKCSLDEAGKPASTGLSARELYASGRWEKLTALPKARTLDREELLWRGVAFAKTDDCSRAIPALERGLKIDELTAGYWLELCYAKAGQMVMSRLVKMGSPVALHEVKGDLLLRLRNDAGAAQWEYAEALKLRPNDPHLLARLADALNQVGETTQAGESARAALAGDPHETLALRLLARMAMSERNYEEAIARLRALAACGPADDWTQVQLGVAYGQSGHPEEAVRYLEPELRANYRDEKGALHALLARSLRKLGRDHDAELAAAEAAKLAASAMESDGSKSLNADR
jgi:tetratricopeptide (TPR) repeat protein